MSVLIKKSFGEIPKENYQNLDSEIVSPFMQYDFLNALEKSKSVSIDSGWEPHHFVNEENGKLNGFMPLYKKYNSAGEFVEGTSTSGSLLSMVGGSEIKISGDNSAQHGIQIDSRRWCGVQIDGGEPTLKTELNGNHDYESTYLTVDNSANFTAGDLISIYRREEDFRLANDECFWVQFECRRTRCEKSVW